MTFKKLLAVALLIAGSLTLVHAGRRSIGGKSEQATCSHLNTEWVVITSSLHPDIKFNGKRCIACNAAMPSKKTTTNR